MFLFQQKSIKQNAEAVFEGNVQQAAKSGVAEWSLRNKASAAVSGKLGWDDTWKIDQYTQKAVTVHIAGFKGGANQLFSMAEAAGDWVLKSVRQGYKEDLHKKMCSVSVVTAVVEGDSAYFVLNISRPILEQKKDQTPKLQKGFKEETPEKPSWWDSTLKRV